MSAEIPDGAVIVARAIINSSLWKMRPADRVVAVTCLAIANKKAKKWFDGHKQITIQRGQFVRSRSEMSQECGLPVQVVRTSLDHLSDSEFLTRNLTKAYTIYTIPKYQHYQDLTKYSDYGVLKPTRDPTRHQPGQTAKSNPASAQAPECNHLGSEGFASLCKLCGENLTSQILKTNHKQQQQTNCRTPSSPTLVGPRNGEGTTDGVVVVVGTGNWPDPILSKPSFGIASTLLEGIQMAKSVAHALATEKPLGLVLRVVQQARYQQKPGGWARTALENDWMLPEARGDELREVIELAKRDVDRANAALARTLPQGVGRLPRQDGESERDWLQRNLENIRSKKSGSAKKAK